MFWSLVVLCCTIALLLMPIRALIKMFLHVMDPMKGKDKLGVWDNEGDK
jgi:hypothetical protein